jgi:hypothetical protein
MDKQKGGSRRAVLRELCPAMKPNPTTLKPSPNSTVLDLASVFITILS